MSRTRHVWLVLYIYEHHEPWLVLIHKWVYRNIRIRTMTKVCWLFENRPTQSIIYVPLQVNTFQKSILLIVQYKYLKSCSKDFILHNLILHYELLVLLLNPVGNLISAWPISSESKDLYWRCTSNKKLLSGAGPEYFYIIHRVGRTAPKSFWVQVFHCCGEFIDVCLE